MEEYTPRGNEITELTAHCLCFHVHVYRDVKERFQIDRARGTTYTRPAAG